MAGADSKKKEARSVLVNLRDNLRVRGVHDPLEKNASLIEPDIDYEGRHYGWDLRPVLDLPVAASPAFVPVVEVCSNEKKKPEHSNTLCLPPAELIKLDAGYWGEYIQEGRRRHFRDFGMIQGLYAWKCRFDPEKAQGNADDFLPAGPSPARSLFVRLGEKGFSAEIASFARARPSSATADLSGDELFIVLPDLHLPERWPDDPDPRNLHQDAEARRLLQEELILCQHAPGWKWFRDMDSTRQEEMQRHIENLIDGDLEASWMIRKKHLVKKDERYTFTRTEFLSEMAFVERRIKAQSTWFYAEGVEDPMLGPEPEDLKPSGLLPGDPSPAIDLVNLLAVVMDLQKEGAKINVVQVGDLFELWMGREFLYRYFPTCDAPLGGSAPKALRAATMSGIGVGDDLQIRQDAGWRNPDDPSAKGFRHYVFDPVERDQLLERHKTGSSYGEKLDSPEFFREIGLRLGELQSRSPAKPEEVGRGVIGRLKTLMRQRLDSALNFCLGLGLPSGNSNSLRQLERLEHGEFLDRYRRPESLPNDEHAWSAPMRRDLEEYLWNKMIVDMLNEVGFLNIHGNHDGYRSDPVFRDAVSLANVTAEEYLSLRGIWFEHGHRWERYNRDGRAFGAGMTNLVYYQFKDMVDLDESKLKYWITGSGEHTMHQPGSSQWFRIINLLAEDRKKEFGLGEVQGFGVYASGHTHSADLVRLQFMRPVSDAELQAKELEEQKIRARERLRDKW